jgi:hypothetical protein
LAVTSFACAKDAQVRSGRFCFAGAALTLRLQVNRALYGRNKGLCGAKTIDKGRKRNLMKSFLLVSTICFLAGCANVKEVEFDGKDNPTTTEMNSSMKEKSIFLKMENGDSSSGRFKFIRNGILEYNSTETESDSAQMASLKSITYNNRALGAATYGVLGFLAAMYIWRETPEGPGLKIGRGILHWSLFIPIGTGLLGNELGRTEIYKIKKTSKM